MAQTWSMSTCLAVGPVFHVLQYISLNDARWLVAPGDAEQVLESDSLIIVQFLVIAGAWS
eukprot:CAMPEP_0171130684 /NCGR_PEP_ID=MMETSP0766_2-20121228/121348_1 /TAXON_ID=439317 /ORGANISM="Gambierdiscus australes, Strain CAWD 149" /LENGTH=59 /DNA_ID=CAMNT_0011593943 /DNA_START=250 /DNA_END=426 /DNA_ORIENTATION=+